MGIGPRPAAPAAVLPVDPFKNGTTVPAKTRAAAPVAVPTPADSFSRKPRALGTASIASSPLSALALGPASTPHAELRAAYDGIDAASAPASIYRQDKNVDAFASRWKTLEGAKKTFDTTYFIWEHDVFGFAFLGHMLKKAKQGLAVRGMIDATGDVMGAKGFKATLRGQDYLQELVNVDPERVQIGIFNPLLKKDLTSLAALIASNHDKLAIADGKVVETGGRNMAAHYFSDPKDHQGVYHDTDVHIESWVAAATAKTAFDAELESKHVDLIKPDLFGNWSKKDIVLIGAYAMMDDWLKAPTFDDREKALLRGDAAARAAEAERAVAQAVVRLPLEGIGRRPTDSDLSKLRKLADELVTNPELRGSFHTQRTSFTADVKLVDNVAVSTEGPSQISDALVSLIHGAKKTIYIHNPYVVLTDRALEALAEAGRRGVSIVFGTNSPESTDSAATQAFFLEDWPLIMARIPNSRVIVARGAQKHHAKTFVIDGVLTGVSTYNADGISARVNSEIVALHWSLAFASDTLASYKAAITDPKHEAIEYQLKRDPTGKVLIDKEGKPLVEVGPEHHVAAEELAKYKKLRAIAALARDHLSTLAPLRHALLDPARDPVLVAP